MTLCPGRYRDVLPRHLLPPQPGHPRVTQGQRHELVQVGLTLAGWLVGSNLVFTPQSSHERHYLWSSPLPSRGYNLAGQENCLRSLLTPLYYR